MAFQVKLISSQGWLLRRLLQQEVNLNRDILEGKRRSVSQIKGMPIEAKTDCIFSLISY